MSTQYPNLIAYLTIDNAVKAIDFYQKAFGAKELLRLTAGPDRIGHAELEVAGQVFMLGDEMPEWGKSAKTLGGTPIKMVLMVDNCDQAVERAKAAGATVLMEPADQFYGFRSSCVKDPFGFEWMLQHQIEKLSNEQMIKRWQDLMAKFAEQGNCPGS